VGYVISRNSLAAIWVAPVFVSLESSMAVPFEALAPKFFS